MGYDPILDGAPDLQERRSSAIRGTERRRARAESYDPILDFRPSGPDPIETSAAVARSPEPREVQPSMPAGSWAAARGLSRPEPDPTPRISLRGSVLDNMPNPARPRAIEDVGAPLSVEGQRQVQEAYNSASPAKRAAMSARTDFVGGASRALDRRYEDANPTALRALSGRKEDVIASRIEQGELPSVAESSYAYGYGKDREVGSAEQTGFDFERAQFFRDNPNIASASRIATGIEDAYGSALDGFGLAVKDALGLDTSVDRDRLFKEKTRDMQNSAEVGQAVGARRNFEGAVTSIATQLPWMAAGVATGTGTVPLAAMIAQSWGESYKDGFQAGLSPGENATRASLFAAFEGLGEGVGLGKLFKTFNRSLADVPTNQLTDAMAIYVAKQVPGEVATTTGQFITDKLPGLGLNQDATLKDYLTQVGDTILTSVIQGGLMYGGAKGLGKVRDRLETDNGLVSRAIQGGVDSSEFDRRAIDAAAIDSMRTGDSRYIDPSQTTLPRIPETTQRETTAAAPRAEVLPANNTFEDVNTSSQTSTPVSEQQSFNDSLERDLQAVSSVDEDGQKVQDTAESIAPPAQDAGDSIAAPVQAENQEGTSPPVAATDAPAEDWTPTIDLPGPGSYSGIRAQPVSTQRKYVEENVAPVLAENFGIENVSLATPEAIGEERFDALKRLSLAYKKLYDIDVVLVDPAESTRLDGNGKPIVAPHGYYAGDGKTLVLNARSSELTEALTHEAVHAFEQNNPDLFAPLYQASANLVQPVALKAMLDTYGLLQKDGAATQLGQVVDALVANPADQAARQQLATILSDPADPNNALARSELVAHIAGHAATPAMYRELVRRSGGEGKAAKIIQALTDFLNTTYEKLFNKRVQYLKGPEGLRQVQRMLNEIQSEVQVRTAQQRTEAKQAAQKPAQTVAAPVAVQPAQPAPAATQPAPTATPAPTVAPSATSVDQLPAITRSDADAQLEALLAEPDSRLKKARAMLVVKKMVGSALIPANQLGRFEKLNNDPAKGAEELIEAALNVKPKAEKAAAKKVPSINADNQPAAPEAVTDQPAVNEAKPAKKGVMTRKQAEDKFDDLGIDPETKKSQVMSLAKKMIASGLMPADEMGNLEQINRDRDMGPEDLLGEMEPYVREEANDEPRPKYSLVRNAVPGETEISTQNPTAKTRTYDPITQMLSIDEAAVEEAMSDKPDIRQKIIDAILEYGFIPKNTPRDSAISLFKKNIVSNLLYLYNSVPKETADRSKLWYDGAFKIATEMAKDYDLSMEQVAAIMAAMSPQKDWFQNVSMAERAIDILTNQKDTKWDSNMLAYARSYIFEATDAVDREKRQDAYDRAVEVMEAGTTLSQMSEEDAAAFVRAYDEAFNSRQYRIVTPEGGFSGLVRKNNGEPSTMMWSTYGPIEKAVSIFRNGSRENISEQLGDEHKIRSFYNNIAAPKSAIGHVTIDTHAVAAALFEALSGTDAPVTQNFGGTGKSAVIGVGGTYGIIADAYREAAKQVGILPREMQSITWEAVRGMFGADEKSTMKAPVRAVWDQYRDGKISFEAAREKIVEVAGGINEPDWKGSDAGQFVKDGGTSYDKEYVPEGGVRLREAKELRQKTTINLTAATSSIPGIKDLYDRAMAGEREAGALIQRVAESSLRFLLSGTKAKIKVIDSIGAYASEREPAISLEVAFNDSESVAVLAALSRFAQMYNQEQIHVRTPTSRPIGHEFGDGSYSTLVHEIPLDQTMSGQEVSEILSQSGLSGLTVSDASITTYWVRPNANPENHIASLAEYEAGVARIYELVGAKSQRNQQSYQRLSAYGRGDGATAGYERIDGDVRTKQASDTQTPRLVAEFLKKGPVEPFKQKALTQAQVKSQKTLASVFEALPSNDLQNPLVKQAYEAAAAEIATQYKALPIKVEVMATVKIGDAVYPYWGPRSQELVDRLIADGMPQAKAKIVLDYLRKNFGQPSKAWKSKAWKGTSAGSIEAMNGDVYPNSAAMRQDVSQNNRLKTFKTSPATFGPEGSDFTGNPLLKDSGLKDANGYPMLYNDLLRAVHDYFAHNLSATEFGPNGEAAAWRNHMASTTSPMARWAITAETRLQNAWQNFRPEAEGVAVKDRPFAPQKASLPPVVFTLTGNDLVDAPMLEFIKTLSEEQRRGSLPADSDIKIPALPDTAPAAQAKFSRAVDAWQNVAKEDDAFKYERSDKKSFQDISKELLPELVWQDKSTRYQTELQAEVQENRYAIFRERNGQVWLDVQELESGESRGSAIYNLVANYAFNNGLVFIGDPAGLSPTGAWRRLSNMISSSLKFGTTDHLFPHPNQFDPSRAYDYNGYAEAGEFAGNYLRPIDWRDGDTRYNLAQMLEAESDSVLAAVPELRDVRFDFEVGQFLDRSYNPFPDDAFTRAAKSPAARSASAGSSTLKRAVFTKSVLLPVDRGGLDAVGERVLTSGVNGTFGRSPLYSRNVPTPGVNFTLPARTVRERISNQLANEVSRVQAVQESVAKQGGVLTDNSDVQMAQTRMYRKAGAQIEKFRETKVRPILKRIAKADIDPDDIALYLYAVHARLRNQQIAAINSQFPDGGSGMFDAEAKAFLKSFRARPDFQTFKRLARELQAITKDTQQLLLSSGLVDRDTVDSWNAVYKGTYIPLKGWEDVDDSMRSTGKMDPRVPFAKRALGRGSRAGQIIENILGDHERAIVMAEKNAVRQAFLRFVLDNKDDLLWEVNRVILTRRFNKGSMSPLGIAQGNVSYVATVDNREANTVAVRVNGKMYSIWVKDAAMLADLNAAIAAADGDVKMMTQAWRSINRGLAKLWTALSPAFVLINAVRDLQSAMIQTGVEKKGGVLRAAGMLPKLLPLAWNIWRAERTGDWTMTGNRYKQAYNEYRDVGAMQSFAGLETLEQKQVQLNKIIAEAKNSITLNPKSWYIEARKFIRAAEEFIMDINGSIENAARVAAYSAARQAGESVKEAVDTAANVTVDFARRGKKTPLFSSLYLFFNPAVQGTRRVAELAFSKKGSAVVSSLVALGYFNAMMAVGAVGDDDEPYWDKPNMNGVKHKNLLFFDAEGNQYKIPLTYGWGFFVNLGQGLYDLQRGKEVGKVASFLTSAFFQHFSPLGSTENLATFVAPTLFDPIAVLTMNKTEQGFPLKPEDRLGEEKPDSEKYWTSSRGTYLQKFTEWLNEATQGSKASPGKIDVSPETLKYLIGFTTGGAGSFVRDTVSAIDLELSIGDGASIQKNQIPILKSFYQTKTIKGEQSAFFENSAEAVKALEEAKLYWGKQAPNAVMERINNSRGLAALGNAQSNLREALSNIRKMEIAVIDNESMSRAEKESARLDLDRKKKELYDRFNRAFYAEKKRME